MASDTPHAADGRARRVGPDPIPPVPADPRNPILAGDRHADAPPCRRTGRRRAAPIAWPAIERDDRDGVLSLRELALEHGCSHSAIANHAGRHGWPSRASIARGADALTHRCGASPGAAQDTATAVGRRPAG